MVICCQDEKNERRRVDSKALFHIVVGFSQNYGLLATAVKSLSIWTVLHTGSVYPSPFLKTKTKNGVLSPDKDY